jgi:hypothetical protein
MPQEDEIPEYKWWLEEPLPPGKKWRTLKVSVHVCGGGVDDDARCVLQHNGVLFALPYKPHGIEHVIVCLTSVDSIVALTRRRQDDLQWRACGSRSDVGRAGNVFLNVMFCVIRVVHDT